MDSYEYYCYYCGESLLEEETCYDDYGNECCNYCYHEQGYSDDYWGEEEEEEDV